LTVQEELGARADQIIDGVYEFVQQLHENNWVYPSRPG
jgi:hypothetical protein